MQYRRFKGLMVGTILSGAAMVTSPALAQSAPPTAPSPPDNSATPSTPDTTAPQEGQSTVPSTNAQAELSERRRTSSSPARAFRSRT